MSFTYTLRALRQSFRSSRPAAPFTRSSRRLELEQLETRLAPACTRNVLSGVLTVNCDGGNNDIRLDRVGSSFVVMADEVTTTHLLTSVTTEIRLNGNAGNDDFSIMPGTAAGSSRNLDGLAGRAVTVNGGPDTTWDVLNINDQGNTTARTFALTNTFVTWIGGPTITYGTVERLTLNAGVGHDVISVLATAFATPVTVNAGAGNDTVTIGDLTPRLTNILGDVTVNGGPDTTWDVLNINDQGNTTARTFTLTTGSVTWGGPTITYGSTVERLTLNAGTGSDIVNIRSTAFTPVTVNAGAGNDTITVGSVSYSLSTILSAVTVHGGPDTTQDVLILNDQASLAAHTYTLTSSSVTWGGPTITYGSTVERLTLNAGAGSDIVNIRSTATDTPVTVNAGAGNDTITVGSVSYSLSTILGNVTVHGGADATQDVLNLDDQYNTVARTFTLTSSTVTWGGPTITYGSTVERLTLNAGIGNDVVNILGTAAATPVTVNTREGNDVVYVGSTHDTLTTILGNVTVNGGGAPPYTWDVLMLLDSDNAAARTFTVTNNSVTWTGGPTITYEAIERLFLNAGTGNDRVNIRSTAFATPVIVSAGAGNDTVTVGSVVNTLAAILGVVNVHGGPDTTQDVLNLNDQGSIAPHTYTLTDSSVSWTGGTVITYNTVERLTLDAGTGNDIVNILSTDAATPVTVNAGAGNDSVTVGNVAMSLVSILGNVTVNGDAHTTQDVLDVRDQGNAAARTFTLTNSSVTWTGGPTITYGTLEGLTLNAGTSNDIVNIRSAAADTQVTVNAGLGNDTITLGNLANSLDDILSLVTVNAGTGLDAITLNDQGTVAARSYGLNSGSFASGAVELNHSNVETLTLNATGFDDVVSVGGNTVGMTVTLNGGGGADTLTGANAVNLFVLTGLDAGVLDGVNTFSSFENMLGYSGSDTFTFASDLASLSGWIDGGGGTHDKLDYSALSGDVYVNLTTWEATGAWYVTNIQDVTGGSGNDVLVGDDQSNILDGGLGHDLLIAGGSGYWGSPDTLLGGGGDILIAGFTAYDGDAASLLFLRDVWAGPASYDDRAAELSWYLTTDTVFYNYAGGGNTLTGGSGMDLFFGDLDLDAHDWSSIAGELFSPIY